MSRKYQVLPPTAPVPAPDDVLEQLVRQGAREILQRALEAEVAEFLGRDRYERSGEFRGYRNGAHPERTIGVGMGAVEVRVPRVSDVPAEVMPEGFRSAIVEGCQRRSRTVARLLVRLYLEGMASGDFEPVFRALLGEATGLSEDTIQKLRGEWKEEYESWRRRPLSGRYVYLFADGLCLKAGIERDKMAVLVILGVREDGQKELLAMEQGYRETAESWAEALRSLKERGMREAPLLVVGDGALGLWAALNDVFPEARQQRCWNHKTLNIIDKLPKRLQPEARKRMRRSRWRPAARSAPASATSTATSCASSAKAPAADCLERDWEELTAFYDFPQEHWLHLRTSNPIECIFAGVRLRTNATKRMRVRESALYLIFKLVCRLSLSWRAINAPNQLTLLLAGHRYVDGKLVLADAAAEPRAVSA